MTLFRICTMSEKPTSSRRLARRIPLCLVTIPGNRPFECKLGSWFVKNIRGGAAAQREVMMPMGSHGKKVCIDRHADHGVDTQSLQRVNLLLAANAAGDDELAPSKFAKALSRRDWEPLHQALAVNVRVEKSSDVRVELRNCIVRRECDLRLPALYSDVAILRVDAGDDLFCADSCGQRGSKLDVDLTRLRKERRTKDNALRTRLKHLACTVDRVDSAPGLAWKTTRDLRNQV